MLHNVVGPGDWVIDIGANVGHYTKRFSELVGARGRVIAFEPVPTTFSLLAANAQLFAYPNVSLVNAAVSDKFGIVGMSMPYFSTGLRNYYGAHISNTPDSTLSVLSMPLDSLPINYRVALVKIDAEGHEPFILAGMRKLIMTSLPFLILETSSNDVINSLNVMGYIPEKLQKSPNLLFRPNI